ncbi:MAG: putative DNA binding domain-containing protein [Acidobacteria bacterium]|jgi:ATP-dependent DNA helicase RecG|nr:putative DNA binding domain-containing protein [Acidobacteriota bacterium]
MEIAELIDILNRGEDSRHQFKENFFNADSLAAEMVAFCNSNGGMILIGVNDSGEVSGLTSADIGRLNQLISNAASQLVRPPVNPETENITHPNGLVMILSLPSGISKPYMDNKGSIWVKSGADKRKVTAREEMQRMFQAAGLIHGDEVPANGISVADLDQTYFINFFKKEYEENLEELEISLPQLLQNMNLCQDSVMNIAGALLFAKRPQFRLPNFIIKAVCYPGNTIDEEKYLDSRDITGKIADIFQQIISFINVNVNIRHSQGSKTVNSPGTPEIPRIVFEELIANALIHRDYFVPAPIRVFVFSDRIEIVSPGHLPNNLTIENIKSGNSNIRNPILASFATKILPYRGLGNGIRRSLKAYPYIEFLDDKDGNLFKVIIKIQD